MCISTPSTPKIPTVPERQAVQQPDKGAPVTRDQSLNQRRAIMAGLITSPQGLLGSPTVAKPTLG